MNGHTAWGGVRPIGRRTGVSVRIDHGLANFNSKLRPILENHQIPYTIALGADTWGLAENAGVTPAMVNGWVVGGLCSIASHGWGNHLDTSNNDTIRKYIVDSKAKLEADIPAAAPVDIFMPPGASGAGGYGGFIPSDGPGKYYGTFAGQTALSTYPLCSGQFPGTSYRVQDGKPRVGQAYFNMDTFTASEVMLRVNTAITNGQGIQLMVHPSFIDGTGYITTAALSSVFSQIAAYRTSGMVTTLSVAHQYLADSRNHTVSQAAGRTVSVWDYLNNREQIIYGDTGPRDVSSLTAGAKAGAIVMLQRVGNTVHLYWDGVSPVATAGSWTWLTLPSGFRPAWNTRWSMMHSTSGASGLQRSSYLFTTGGLGNFVPTETDNYRHSLTYITNNPWPTTLPGSAVGSIPA